MGYSPSQTAPAWVLSTGYSPSGTECCTMGSLQTTDLAKIPAPVWACLHCHSSWWEPDPAWGPPQAAVWITLALWAAEGQPTSSWSSLQVAGESLLKHLEHFFSLLFQWQWYLQGYLACIFLVPIPHSCCAAFFYPFLNVIPDGLSYGCRWGCLGAETGTAHGFFSQKPSLPIPCYQNLAT